MMKFAYLDTWAIIGVIKGEHTALRTYEKLKQRSDVMVVIPEIAVGEARSVIIKRNLDGKLEKFYDIIANCKIMPLEKKAIACATKICDMDQSMEATDSLIVAQAITDHRSICLITGDKRVSDSTKIADIQRQMIRDGARDEPIVYSITDIEW